AISFQSLVLIFRCLISDPLAPAHFLQGREHLLLADAERTQKRLGASLDLHQAQKQVLDRDILVLHPLGFSLRSVENLAKLRAYRKFAARSLGENVQSLFGSPLDLIGIDAKLRKK